MNELTNPVNAYPVPANTSSAMGGGSKEVTRNGFDIIGSAITIEVLSYLGEKDQANFNPSSKTLHGDVQKYLHIKKQPFIQNTKSLIDAINLTPYLDRSVHFKALLKKLSSQKEQFLFLESANKFLEIKLQMLCVNIFSGAERREIKSKLQADSLFYSFLENSEVNTVENAFEIALSIKNKEYKFLALIALASNMTLQQQERIVLLIKKDTTPGQVDKALVIAGGITDQWQKSHALGAIISKSTTSEQVDKTLEIAEGITLNPYKSYVIKELIPKIATSKQVDKALDIVGGITDDFYRDEPLKAIMSKITTSTQVDKALEIAETVVDKYDKGYTFMSISVRLVEMGQMKRALEIAHRITSNHVRRETLKALKTLAKKLLHLGR